MEIKNSSNNFWVSFIICALSYGIINFLFLSHNHIISYPVQGDDYHELAFRFSLKYWDAARPIYYFFAPFFALLGRTGYYLWMHCLVILCALTVFRFARNFFSFSLPIEWFIFYTVLVFSFPFVVTVSKFLGASTSLFSTLFAITSMLSLLKGDRENKNLFFILAAFLFTLSLFTKEDFILPNILLIIYLFFFDDEKKIKQDDRKKKLCFYLGYSLIAIMALFLFNKYVAHNAYTGMGVVSSAEYTVNISIPSIFHVFIHYLTLTDYIRVISISVLLILVLCMYFANQQIKIKILFCVLCILSLIMPYSVLPNHLINFYSYNWMPWEGVIIVFGLFSLISSVPKRVPRIFICILLTVISIIAVKETQTYRNDTSHFYESEANFNKNILSTLTQYKAQLNQLNNEDYVGVVGLDGLTPWADPSYLQYNLGLKPKWIIFVDKKSIFFPINSENKINPYMRLSVLNIEKICDFPHMKYLYFTSDGKGELKDNCRGINRRHLNGQ